MRLLYAYILDITKKEEFLRNQLLQDEVFPVDDLERIVFCDEDFDSPLRVVKTEIKPYSTAKFKNFIFKFATEQDFEWVVFLFADCIIARSVTTFPESGFSQSQVYMSSEGEDIRNLFKGGKLEWPGKFRDSSFFLIRKDVFLRFQANERYLGAGHYEDLEYFNRLAKAGILQGNSDFGIIHIWHPKRFSDEEFLFNESLYNSREKKKFISVMLYNRPEYAKQTLEHVFKCRKIENFDVVVFIDPDGTDEQFKLARQFPVSDVVCFPKHLGQRVAHQHALHTLFNKYKAEWVVYVEDDMLLGPDALEFYLEVEKYLFSDSNQESTLGSSSAWSNPWSRACWSIGIFVSTWTSYFSRRLYYEHIIPAYEIVLDYPLTHDCAINQRFIDCGLRTLMSNVPRAKNIGEKNPTHSQEKTITSGEHWTGSYYRDDIPIVILDENFPIEYHAQKNQA